MSKKGYKEYTNWYSCYDCGVGPSRKEYENHLEREVKRLKADLEKVWAYEPNEFKRAKEERAKKPMFAQWVNDKIMKSLTETWITDTAALMKTFEKKDEDAAD